MKVALVHKRMGMVGGLEARLRNYIDYFVQRGDHVTVFCYKIDPNFHIPDGVEVVRLNMGGMPKPYRTWYFNHKLNKIFDPNDFDFSLALGRTSQQRACLAPGDHLGFLDALGRKNRRRPSDHVQINLDKAAFNNSEIIFPCSDLVKHNLQKWYGIEGDRVFTIKPPLNTNRYNRSLKAERPALRKKFNMSDDKKTFVIASTSHRRKGIPLLLKVFKQLVDLPVELKIAGSPRVRTRLPNVEYIGYAERSEELFTAGDFSIHPAIYEPFGQVISESLACGTPVLISKNTGWSTDLPTSYGSVISTYEVDDWVDAIKKAITSDYDIPEDFAEIHELTLEQHMEKMIGLYQKHLSNGLSADI